jgi:hypothetical protein
MYGWITIGKLLKNLHKYGWCMNGTLSLKLSLVMDDYPLDKDLNVICYGHQMTYQFMSPMIINPSGH